MISLVELTVADPPDAWRAAGFHVDQAGTSRIGGVDIRCTGRQEGHKGITGWTLSGSTLDGPALDDTGVDGIATTIATPPDGDTASNPPAPTVHPNGTIAIDHVVVASPDPGRTVDAFETVGLAPRRTRTTDTYGAPMRQTFFRAGEVIIELIGPDEGTWGDDPASFFGLALTVVDLDATVEHLGAAAGRPKDAVQAGRRIMTLRHRELGMTVPTAFMSPQPP